MTSYVKGTAAVLAVTALACGCATTDVDAPIRISNLKQGLARVESQDRGTIYSEGASFRIERNGDCIVATKTVPCMWWAIAFDYEAKPETTTLTCLAAFDAPVTIVDVKERRADVREFSGQMTLNGTRGHAFWPGYVTIEDDTSDVDRLMMTCQLEGSTVLQVRFEFFK